MKHTAAAFFAAFLAFGSATGQSTSGAVHYLETISLDIKLDGEAAQFAAMLPKEQKNKYVLLFNPDASIFQPETASADEPVPSQPGVQFRMQAPQEKFHTNFSTGGQTALRDFMGRKFLVAGAVKKHSWKITGRQKTILKYPCQEAVLHRKDDTVTAWFTSAIPVSAGPRDLAGLPGLILETREGRMHSMVATSVQTGSVPSGAIAVPKGGRKVTPEAFKAIVDEKMRELEGEQSGGGAKVIIRTQHR